MTNDLLNFRCPPELLAAVDALGCSRYPNPKAAHGCDRSKTLLDIVRAGIEALSDGSIVLPASEVRQQPNNVKQATSNTVSDSELDERITTIVERKTAALRDELLGELAA
jgi:hypothetical protein